MFKSLKNTQTRSQDITTVIIFPKGSLVDWKTNWTPTFSVKKFHSLIGNFKSAVENKIKRYFLTWKKGHILSQLSWVYSIPIEHQKVFLWKSLL